MVHPELGVHGCRTLYEGWRRGGQLNPLGPCLGYRAISTTGLATPFVYSSYTECLARVDAFAAGLDHLGLLSPNEDNLKVLGLYSRNCMEWVLAEHACFAVHGVTAPLYDTLGPDTVQFVLTQTSAKSVLATRRELGRLCQAKQSGKCEYFTHVILVDGVTPQAAQHAQDAGLQIISFAKVEALGAECIATTGHQHQPPSPNDIATLCYTSGTTGDPKGALLTHQNLLAAIAGVEKSIPELEPHLYDRHLSYLPLAHIMERVTMAKMLMSGASVAFYRGDPLYLLEDLQACRPTLLPAAPRVLNKIYDKVSTVRTPSILETSVEMRREVCAIGQQPLSFLNISWFQIMLGMAAAGGTKKKLFDAALAAKTDGLQRGTLHHAIYDTLIFNKIKRGLGMDCVRLMLSGSAPLSEDVMTFFRCLLGIPVVEGYGQTEGSAGCTISHPRDITTVGHVGGPIGAVEVVLMDVPEMGYLHTDTHHRTGQPCCGRGEICVRGPNVFQGYYKDEKSTRETIDSEGWLHSGDIGLWRPDGSLQIIDRKKNIFKLSQGEYVAPEKIENLLLRSPLIAQCFVYGDSLQSCLVAIVIPDEESVRRWATTHEPQLSHAPMSQVCQSTRLKQVIQDEINQVSRDNGLHGFEVVKAIHLDPNPFSVDRDLMTPTFKLKRPKIRDAYQAEIQNLYANMPSPRSKL